jgi:hypothetical protein
LLSTIHTPSASQQAIAQNRIDSPSLGQVTFEPPPGQDSPDQTAGGGSRGSRSCPNDSRTFALRTVQDHAQDLQLQAISDQVTTASHPTVTIQVPSTSAASASFSFLTERGDLLYEATLPLSYTPTLISVTLPEHQPSLSIGDRYYWMFSLVCDPANRLLDVAIGGAVERVRPQTAGRS